MTIAGALRQQVRERAGYACEFCGVSEADTGGLLTVDHFRPRASGGDDSLENLLYACARCNLYKHDYWPDSAESPSLWNPRHEPAERHFLQLDDGRLAPLTPTGAFTIRRLRLNRSPLVTYRRKKEQRAEVIRLLTEYRDILRLLGQMNAQLSTLVEQQQELLEEQERLLRLLLGNG